MLPLNLPPLRRVDQGVFPSFTTVPILYSEKCFFRAQPRITTRQFAAAVLPRGSRTFYPTHATGNFAMPKSPAKREIKYKSTQDCKNVK